MTTAPAPRSRAAAPPSTAVAVPAKPSKLALAMEKVNGNIARVNEISTAIVDLKNIGPKKKFDLTTKEGRDLAESTRKNARKHRLDLKGMRDDATALFNDIKKEFWGVVDPFIGELQAIEDNAKAQQEAEATKEENRKQAHRESITAIGRMSEGISTFTLEQLEERRTAVEAVIVDNGYEEFEQQAKDRKAEVLGVLDAAIDMAKKRVRADANMAQMRAWKELPKTLEGTGADNIREALRILRTQEPTMGAFGEMLEVGNMAFDAVCALVTAMLEKAEAAPAEKLEDGSAPAEGDLFEAPAGALSAPPPAEPDPFTVPQGRAPAPRGSAPVPRGRAAAPVSAPAAPAAASSMPMMLGHVVKQTADPLAAARAPATDLPTSFTLGGPPRDPLSGKTPAEAVAALRAAGVRVPGYMEACIHGMPIAGNTFDLAKMADGALLLFAVLPRNVTIELEDGPLGRGFIKSMQYLRAALDQHNHQPDPTGEAK